MVQIKINGIELDVPKGTTVLEAAEKAGITIPTLCYHKDLSPTVVVVFALSKSRAAAYR